MLMLIHILQGTPSWVYGLLASLLVLGAVQTADRRASLTRVMLLPLAMTGLAAWGVVGTFGSHGPALALWLAGLSATALVVLGRPVPAGVRWDSWQEQFHIAGSWLPMLLILGIFFTKYTVGVTLALHPALAHDARLALPVSLLYGAFSGIFVGRAARLVRLALAPVSNAGNPTRAIGAR